MLERGVWPAVRQLPAPAWVLGCGVTGTHRSPRCSRVLRRAGPFPAQLHMQFFCQCISRFQAVQRVRTDQGRQKFTLSKEFQSPSPGCLRGGGPCTC